MRDILIGAFVVSAIHALMPDHWIPLVLISRAEGWSQSETLWVSAIVTLPHMISTILLGMAVGLIGFQLSTAYELIMERLAPTAFILIGGYYILRGLREKGHHHHVDHEAYEGLKGKSKKSYYFLPGHDPVFFPMRPYRELLPCGELCWSYRADRRIGDLLGGHLDRHDGPDILG